MRLEVKLTSDPCHDDRSEPDAARTSILDSSFRQDMVRYVQNKALDLQVYM